MTRFLIIIIAIGLIGCKNEQRQNQTVLNDNAKNNLTESSQIDSVEILFKELSKKSIEYNRFKRNEIFAKHGYIFSDSSLTLFFQQYDWYNPTTKNVKLNDKEINEVELFKRIESTYHSKNTPTKIVFSMDYVGFPLFYVVWRQANTHISDNLYFDGGFFLLSKDFYWTLSCDGIPPEFIMENANYSIELIDDQVPIERSDIKQINYDKSCKGGKLPELLIYLEGPSDDYAHVILGFDNNDKFRELYSAGLIENHKITNDSTLLLYTEERFDYFGTGWCTRVYNFNTRTKELKALPIDERYFSTTATTTDTVYIYGDFKSSEDKIKSGVIAKVKPNTSVELIKHQDKEFCYEIKSDSISGWMNYFDNDKFGFLWPD